MSNKDSMFGRYTYDNTNDIYPTTWPQYNFALLERQQYATLAERHIFVSHSGELRHHCL